ncbi:MAG: hypothetical protein ACM31L_16460 [Actinomycetota bacterium]
MADNTTRVGSSLLGRTPSVQRPGPDGGSPTRAPAQGGSSAKSQGDGVQVFRMLPADTPVETLDRTARRGTYLDILV